MAWIVFLVAALLQTAGVERLEVGHQPLARDWSESEGRARLVTILSPT